MALSVVAAILDGYGGAPVVVTRHRRDFRHHARPGMIIVEVEGLRVREPVPWHEIPELLRRVDEYVDWWISTRNDPDILDHPAVKLYQIRRRKTDHGRSIDLNTIVHT